jgi:hypothetical protein
VPCLLGPIRGCLSTPIKSGHPTPAPHPPQPLTWRWDEGRHAGQRRLTLCLCSPSLLGCLTLVPLPLHHLLIPTHTTVASLCHVGERGGGGWRCNSQRLHVVEVCSMCKPHPPNHSPTHTATPHPPTPMHPPPCTLTSTPHPPTHPPTHPNTHTLWTNSLTDNFLFHAPAVVMLQPPNPVLPIASNGHPHILPTPLSSTRHRLLPALLLVL